MGKSLPPGFRFHPTDVELVWYYLKRKVMGKPVQFEVIAEVELYKFAPWDLPEKSCLKSKDLEWYFFCPRDRKYANGSRTNRATDVGYWKTTGKDRCIIYSTRTVGRKKTLIFHLGKAPRGTRTDWVMYEYRLEDKELLDAGVTQDAYVLCKIFQKSGPGPRNGEQYGAPFNEEDWEDDTGIECSGSVSCVFSTPAPFDDQATLLEPVIPELASGAGEVSSVPALPDDEALWEELIEALCDSPLLIVGAHGQTSGGSITLPNNPNRVSDMELQGIYNGLGDPTVSAEQTAVDSCSVISEYTMHPTESANEDYLNLDYEQLLMEIDPSELVTPDDLFIHNPLACLPGFENLNSTDISASLVCNGTTASAINSSPPGPNIDAGQASLSLEMDGFGDENNEPGETEQQCLNSVLPTENRQNITSCSDVRGSGSKNSFFYADSSTCRCSHCP